MYRHRPDATSFGFGLAFVIIALSTLFGPGRDIDPGLVVGALAMAVGTSLIGRLLLGDVHRAAADRLAGNSPHRTAPALTAEAHVGAEAMPLHIDHLFDSPIDPDTLDAEFRARFGDDDVLGQV